MVPLFKEDFCNQWQQVQAILEDNFGEEVYNAWLKKLQLVSFSEYEIIMSVPTNFIKDWINREYLSGLQKKVNGERIWVKKGILQILQEAYPKLNTVDIIVDKTQKIEEIPVSNNVEIILENESNVESFSKNNNLYNIGTNLNVKYTFENFVVGESNKLAYSIAQSLVENENIDNYTNPLFLYGGVGLGKTHLCQAIAWEMKEKYPNKNIIYLSAEKFMYLFVQSLQNQDIATFKTRFRNVDVLIIDDIHFIAGKESTQKEFFQTFNTLIDENKQIILACDKSPLNLEKVDDQLKSRMSGGIVVDILEPDYELRLNLIKAKCKQIGLELASKIELFLAEKIVASGREIEGCIKKLAMHQKFIKTEITFDIVEKILSDSLNRVQKIITIDKIQEIVSEFFKISLADLKSEKRNKELVIPRHIAMYLSKKMTDKSFPDVAKKFGGKNHSTVIHAIKKVEELINLDLEISNNILKIKNILNS